MNRNEKREQERKKKSLQSWLKSFNSDQKKLLEEIILSEIEKNDETTMLIIDKCYMAAIANNIEVDITDLEKIIKESSTYMEDYKNKLEKGDMREMVKSLENKIKLSIKAYIKSGKNKVVSIKELEREYQVPFAELDVMWLQVKSKMGIVNKHAPKKAIAEQEVEEVLEGTKELPYSVTEKEIEEAQKEIVATITPTGITTNGVFKESKLKIIEQTIKIQGEYGIYIKTSEGVKTDKITVKDIKDLEEYKKSVENEFDKRNKELSKQIEDIKQEIINLAKRADKNFAIIKEIEQVFNL